MFVKSEVTRAGVVVRSLQRVVALGVLAEQGANHRNGRLDQHSRRIRRPARTRVFLVELSRLRRQGVSKRKVSEKVRDEGRSVELRSMSKAIRMTTTATITTVKNDHKFDNDCINNRPQRL